jgi:hypothetical protein
VNERIPELQVMVKMGAAVYPEMAVFPREMRSIANT